MIKESYNYLGLEDKTQFFFASEGTQGKILKGIIFTHYKVITQTFHIIGNSEGIDEKYLPENFYDIFILIRKFVQ